MNRKWARCRLLIILLAATLASAQSIMLAGNTALQAPKKEEKSGSKKAPASLTGCIDEQEGHYVLVDDRTLTPVANLEADGFPTEAFAKYLGHKVTVRGISNSGAGLPVFKVRSVDIVRQSCAPQQ